MAVENQSQAHIERRHKCYKVLWTKSILWRAYWNNL